MHSLQKVLRRAGQPTQSLRFPNGTQLLVLPQGGRVLGLYAPDRPDNFFWTHSALETAAGARELLANPRWPNPGGDRTWLSPSTELFIGDLKRIWETYREPATVDPGSYRCVVRDGALRLVNRARLQLFRRGGTALVEISKTYAPAPDPLRHERKLDVPVSYAGYATTLALRILSNPREAHLALWPLLQLPPGGEMILPTFHRAPPLTIFGKIPRADVRVTDRLIRYRMHSRTTAKLAVRAVATPGRMGYVRTIAGGQAELVIRNFPVNPSGEYVDTPFDNLADLGYSVQACNVAEPTLGDFSEIEHHVPITRASGASEVSQVWAYRGSRASIQKVMRRLLTSSSFRLTA